jgi:hypothetical protein
MCYTEVTASQSRFVVSDRIQVVKQSLHFLMQDVCNVSLPLVDGCIFFSSFAGDIVVQ